MGTKFEGTTLTSIKYKTSANATPTDLTKLWFKESPSATPVLVWQRVVESWHTVWSGSVIQNSLDANPNPVDFGSGYTLSINSSAQQVRATGKAGLYDAYSDSWSSYNEGSATLTSKSNSMVNVVSIYGVNADSYLDVQWWTNNNFSAQARNTFWNYDYYSIPVVEMTLVEAYY